jgi:hypothetical protein
MIEASARKRAETTRERTEMPIMRPGRPVIADPVHPPSSDPQ